MQIELAPEVEAKLSAEASRRAITATELSKELQTHHVFQLTRSSQQIANDSSDDLIQSYPARMKAKSPGWETRDLYAVDWRAIKAEGRKY